MPVPAVATRHLVVARKPLTHGNRGKMPRSPTVEIRDLLPDDGKSPEEACAQPGSTPRGRYPRRVPVLSKFGVFALRVFAVAVAYYVAAIVGLRLALVGAQVTPLWPPTGIALAALL